MEKLTWIDVDRVRGELRTQGLKRWWVAEQAGLHRTTLRRWLNGPHRPVDVRLLTRLAHTLGVPPESLRVRRPPGSANA